MQNSQHLTVAAYSKDEIGHAPQSFNFDITHYRKQQFLHGARADIESLTWCIRNALLQDARLSSDAMPYTLIDCGFGEGADWWASTSIELITDDGKSAEIVIGVDQTNDGRLYNFQSDSMYLSDIYLDGRAEEVLQHLVTDVMKQL
jgi:hypothetical protein